MAETHQLIDFVTPDVDGILWASKKYLTMHPWPFNEMDYLCNGQLTKLALQLQKGSIPAEKLGLPHFIATKQFDRPFFICQLKVQDSKKALEHLKQTLKIQLPSLKGKKEGAVLLINTTESSFYSSLKASFPDIEFRSINPEEIGEWT